MKLGCCVNMLDSKAPVGEQYFEGLAEWGYDYVELPLAQVMELSDDEFDSLCNQLKQVGIPCECCNNFFPAAVRLTGEDVSMSRVEEYLKQAMTRAGRLGARIIVFGSSGAKNIPEGFPKGRAFQQVVEVLRLVDRYAADYGIQIAIEPLNHLESNLILNFPEAVGLMRETNCEQIKVLVDYYHFMAEQDSRQKLLEHINDLVHVHFAKPEGRGIPQVMEPEYADFIRLLKAQNYPGRFSVEAFSKNPEVELKRFAKLYREIQ